MPKRPARTVIEVAIARKGFRRGSKAMTVMTSWLIAEVSLGHPPSMEEYSEWWKMSLAKAYRDRQLWTDVFPEFPTPTALFDLLGIDRSLAEKANVPLMVLPAT